MRGHARNLSNSARLKGFSRSPPAIYLRERENNQHTEEHTNQHKGREMRAPCNLSPRAAVRVPFALRSIRIQFTSSGGGGTGIFKCAAATTTTVAAAAATCVQKAE